MNDEGSRPCYYLGLDLGGTNIKGGVVDDQGRPLAAVSGPTRADLGPEIGLDTLAEVAGRAVLASGLDWGKIEAIGLGAAGTLDTASGRIIDASNLRLWNGFPLGPRLAERLDRPTFLLNDANAAAFGEYWAGAGRTTESLVLFTIGTGIGCGIVESGRIIEGRHGLGGECGHMTIQMDDGRPCSCGMTGHLEAYASVSSLVARAVEGLEAVPDSLLTASRLDGTLNGQEIYRCSELGDALALRLIQETARALAVGASVVMHTIDPDLVLFGGGMTAAGPSFLKMIGVEIQKLVFPSAWENTRVEFASLGGDAGFIGAAGWAKKASIGSRD
jgi:glucokinase